MIAYLILLTLAISQTRYLDNYSLIESCETVIFTVNCLNAILLAFAYCKRNPTNSTVMKIL